MKSLIVILILILLFTTNAKAYDKECTAGEFTADSIPINISGPSLKIIEPAKVDSESNWVSIKLALKDGTIVEYSQGGCFHYRYKYEFSNIKKFPQNLNEKTVKLMRSYLNKLPIKNGSGLEILRFLSEKKNLVSLQKLKNDPANINSDGYVLPYVNGYIDVNLRKDGFALIYDFAL